MTPLPRPDGLCSSCSPWKNLNQGSWPDERDDDWLVLMLTTAGDANRAGALRLPAGRPVKEPAGA